MNYKFTMSGICLSDGKTYQTECWYSGMSKDEKEDWIRESNFDPKTVNITKNKA